MHEFGHLLTAGGVVASAIGNFLDGYGQWFFLEVVYAYELPCLVVASALVLLLRRRYRGVVMRTLAFLAWAALVLVVLVYLAWFEMHWYSLIAWPLVVAAFLLDWSRFTWYRAIRDHPLTRTWWSRLGAGLSRWRTWVVVGPVVLALVVAVGWLNMPVSISLLAFLGVVLALGIALKAFLHWFCKGFWQGTAAVERYLRADPRMVHYLDAVRRVRAVDVQPGPPLLADDRFTHTQLPRGTLSFWVGLFRLSQGRVVSWLLRRLAQREWMPTIESAYMVQHVAWTRDEAWKQYESARYGDPTAATLAKAAEAYYERAADHLGKADPRRPPALPPEMDAGRLQPMRVTYLALTEALAECHCFSDLDPNQAERRPDFLHAAELLSRAGELQHEIARDLRLCGGAEASEADAERALALHFFDLCARAIEAHLAPGSVRRARPWDVEARRKHFCTPLVDGTYQTGPSMPAPPAVQVLLRRALVWRYGLIERLRAGGRADRAELAHVGRLTDLPTVPADQLRDDWDVCVARVQEYTAAASLWLELGRGDQARMPRLVQVAPELPDRMGALRGFFRRMALAAGARRDAADCALRAKRMEQRVFHLLGLAMEQEMEHLITGSGVWFEHCEQAANWHTSGQSLRVRRVCALVRAVGPGALPGAGPTRRTRGEGIVELV